MQFQERGTVQLVHVDTGCLATCAACPRHKLCHLVTTTGSDGRGRTAATSRSDQCAVDAVHVTLVPERQWRALPCLPAQAVLHLIHQTELHAYSHAMQAACDISWSGLHWKRGNGCNMSKQQIGAAAATHHRHRYKLVRSISVPVSWYASSMALKSICTPASPSSATAAFEAAATCIASGKSLPSSVYGTWNAPANKQRMCVWPHCIARRHTSTAEIAAYSHSVQMCWRASVRLRIRHNASKELWGSAHPW